jgi:hypothetical protein
MIVGKKVYKLDVDFSSRKALTTTRGRSGYLNVRSKYYLKVLRLIILYGILGLGVPEIVIVIIALLLLLSPKDLALIKPIVKAVYKGWLEYQGEVDSARKEMEGLKHTVMKPLEDAEREVEIEVSRSRLGMKKSVDEARGTIGREVSKAKEGMKAAGIRKDALVAIEGSGTQAKGPDPGGGVAGVNAASQKGALPGEGTRKRPGEAPTEPSKRGKKKGGTA